MKITNKSLELIKIDDTYFYILEVTLVKYKNKVNTYAIVVDQDWYDKDKKIYEQDWHIVRVNQYEDNQDNIFIYTFITNKEFENVLDKLEEEWFPEKFNNNGG